jgi:hypothetical protein
VLLIVLRYCLGLFTLQYTEYNRKLTYRGFGSCLSEIDRVVNFIDLRVVSYVLGGPKKTDVLLNDVDSTPNKLHNTMNFHCKTNFNFSC